VQRRDLLPEAASVVRRGRRERRPVSGPDRIQAVVCDDHDVFRRGVVEMLSVAGEGIEVVGEARTHDEAAAVVRERRPEVVLLDLEMPGGAMGPTSRWGACSGSRRRPGSSSSPCTTSRGW
jgi:CheY-like chemotaxis protein